MNKFLLTLLTFIVTVPTLAAINYKALPIVGEVRVLSSEPRKVVWSGLTDKEKNLAIHLLAAAKAGQPIIYFQNHRHGLTIKQMIETSLSDKNLKKTKKLLGKEAFKEFINYAAKFIDHMGPYEASNRKYILSKVSPKNLETLFKQAMPKIDSQNLDESIKLLTDTEYEVISQPEDAEGTALENAGGNLYQKGLTGAEVVKAFKNGLKSDVNCRIVRSSSGELECEVQALNNPKIHPVVRKALTGVVAELKQALPYTLSVHQSNQLKYLIKYLEKGDVEDFRQMNIEWVKDGTKSKVDFMMGYVEVYQDYQNKIGAWESYVQIIDPELTKLSVSLAHKAQSFENDMPYGEFKKIFPKNYAPPALMVYYFQEISGFRSGGYNLPNYDDIRRDVGAKNIIRLELPGEEKDPLMLRLRREMVEEFAPKNKVNGIVDNWLKSRRLIVLLHEIIGHGSGTYDEEKYGAKVDPVAALGALASALEEQRADLTALVFGADPKLVEVGFYAHQKEALKVRNSLYDIYLTWFMNGVAKQQSLSEAHQRGHWLLINKLMQAGAIEKVSRDGSPITDENYVLAVKDYEKFHKVSYDLLAELQRIKATRDESALKELFTKHAPLEEINERWMQVLIPRGRKLAINAGAIEQPWHISDKKVRVFGKPTLEKVAPHFDK